MKTEKPRRVLLTQGDAEFMGYGKRAPTEMLAAIRSALDEV
jgi:hypothetical protein